MNDSTVDRLMAANTNPNAHGGPLFPPNTDTGGTPPAPSMPVPQKPKDPATWESGSGSQGAYGNDY